MSRVLHLAKRYTGAPGGDAVVCANLVYRQRAAGHEVTVLTSNSREIVDGPGVEKFGLPIRAAQIDVINARRIISLVGLFARSLWLLRRIRPDIVHAHTVDMGAAIALAAWILRVPRVLLLHGTSLGSDALSPAKQRLERWLVQAGRYDAILCVTPAALPLLAGLGRTAARYLPNAVELDGFPPQPYPVAGAPLLFVGRLESVKGLDVLLQALAIASEQGNPLRLRLIGSGSLQGQLRRMAADLGVASCVEFLGPRSAADVAEELGRAAALVLPSRYEGFPIVVLEAWATARPAVVTAVGAVPDFCADGVDALVVPPSDAHALAAALIALTSDPLSAARMGQAGRRKVEERYTTAAVAAMVATVYEEVGRVPATTSA